MTLCIGLMSGTSADGMDACLVRIDQDSCELIHALCVPYPEPVAGFLRALAVSETLTAELAMDADQLIAQYAVDAVQQLLQESGYKTCDIQLIGSHGHTLRHRPQPDGFSWQIGDPSWIAERTGITCIADFRRRDIAAGGQGAPLVPAFHRFVFGRHAGTAVLNIGGIANITVLGEQVCGFDTGPGNALIDEWCLRSTGQAFDEGGAFAASGVVITDLLEQWLELPYFAALPPKSTGRELFTLDNFWIPDAARAEDIAATLTELTARSVAEALHATQQPLQRLLLCGGGMHNALLCQRLAALLPELTVTTTDEAGVPGDWMEAMAFAWLGWRTLHSLSGNLPAVTGAAGERILGGIYPAG